MNARGSLWLPLVVLLLLAGLSFWIERSVQLSASNSQAPKTDPEGIMENFDALRTDTLGRPQYRLSAKKLRHYSGNKRTELESPRFVLLDNEAGNFSAEANQATVSADGNELDLRGEVNMLRAAQAGRSALSLRSGRVIVYSERNLLRSPGPVDIEDASMKVHAGAMEYNAKSRIIKLSGRVKARFNSGKR